MLLLMYPPIVIVIDLIMLSKKIDADYDTQWIKIGV